LCARGLETQVLEQRWSASHLPGSWSRGTRWILCDEFANARRVALCRGIDRMRRDRRIRGEDQNGGSMAVPDRRLDELVMCLVIVRPRYGISSPVKLAPEGAAHAC
jgi:hypothetical protein